MTNRRIVLSTLGMLAVSGLLLTGCSIGPQSKADACKVLQSDVSGSAKTLEGAYSKITDDPSAAEKALNAFEAQLAGSVAKVTNPTVRAAGDSAVKSLHALDADLKKYSADPTDSSVVASLNTDGPKVQTSFSNLGKVCSA